MSNLNNCCGDSAVQNIFNPIPGPAGASAYIYVAFAETVINGGSGPSSGTPSEATAGFQIDYPTSTSDWFAIITSTTPLSPPTLHDFDGYWVPLTGIVVSGINVKDDGTAVAGGPFNILNFEGVGLTGVTVTDSGGGEAKVQIVTAGLIKTYWSAFQALVAANQLVAGASYWIVDIGDGEGSNAGLYQAECSAAYYSNFGTPAFQAYAHNTGIIVRAINTNTIDPHGIYLARVPNTSTTQWFMPGTSYAANAPVASYNQVFTNSTGAPLVATVEPAANPTSWTFIPRDNTTHYTTEVQGCQIDISYLAGTGYPAIRERWDNKNNRLKLLSLNTDNEFIKKIFRWGVNTISNNTIYFFDDVLRRGAVETLRTPAFVTGGQLMNYSNVQVFNHNKVDVNLTATSTPTLKVGTRFFRVYFNSLAAFYCNTLNNAVVSNITSSSSVPAEGYQFLNNEITSSVINNIRVLDFSYNIITENSVLGDIYYFNSEAATDSTNTLMESLNFTSLPNEAILLNLGSKSWQSAAAPTSDITATGGGVDVVLENGVSAIPHTAAPNDYVVFTVGSPAPILGNYYQVSATPAANIFTIADPTIPLTTNVVINCRFFFPSIGTSMKVFRDNVVKNSVFRGINKVTSTAALSGSPNYKFINNVLTDTYIENYSNHINNTAFTQYYYDAPGAEITGVIKENTFTNAVLWNNKITTITFVGNDIEYATIALNHDNIPSGGVLNGGISGNFLSNTFRGNNKIGVLKPDGVTFSYKCYQAINVWQNSFVGSFYRNSLYLECIISNNTLLAGSQVKSCTFKSDNLIDGGTVFIPTNAPGLTNVTVNSGSSINYATFEGKNGGLDSLTWLNTNEVKQLSGVDRVSQFLLRDQKLSGYLKGTTYQQFLPGLVGANKNPIRVLTVISNAPSGFSPGGFGPYQISTYTIEITTQFPHMITNYVLGTVAPIRLELRMLGFTSINIVDVSDPLIPQGIYRTINLSQPYPYNFGITVYATPTSVIDEYVFRCTISEVGIFGPTGGYLLDPTNGINDSQGNPAPGPGLDGTYSEASDPGANVSFTDWFKSYQSGGTYNANLSSTDAILAPGYFDISTRISVNNSFASPPATPTGQPRILYQFKDWAAGSPSIRLYNPTTPGSRVLTMPHFFDKMSSTVILGSWGAAPTVEIDQIRDMPEMLPVRFVATPGTFVQFNLVAASAAPTTYPSIIKDSAATSITITSYYDSPTGAGGYLVYDELILMRQGAYIKILDKIIHQ
jgi:hypothetical protein